MRQSALIIKQLNNEQFYSILICNLFLKFTFLFLDSGGSNALLGINGSINVCTQLETLELQKSICLLLFKLGVSPSGNTMFSLQILILLYLMFIGMAPFLSCIIFKHT